MGEKGGQNRKNGGWQAFCLKSEQENREKEWGRELEEEFCSKDEQKEAGAKQVRP